MFMLSPPKLASGLLPRRDRLPVTGFRVLWVIAVLWCELGVFFRSVDKCRWPDGQTKTGHENPDQHDTHILVVADPQILDHRSYPTRSSFSTFLTRLVVDLNLRKNWRAALRTRPHAVVFLGDMMDGGRFAMSDSEYEAYFRRFKSIFKMDASLQAYFVPGNHDLGLGASSWFSEHARDRFRSHFGPLNYEVPISGHSFMFLDAPGLVEEDYLRRSHKESFDQWEPPSSGAVKFVKLATQAERVGPTVLFTHIPLSRPDGASCGPQRERGTIRAGVGFGYQNTLTPSTTKFLLERIKPSLVFSGDDHDYCEYTHQNLSSDGSPAEVQEVTVKSLSMAMGVRRPGFQLLSLTSASNLTSREVPANKLCLLPDQLGIYLSTYIPLFVFTFLTLLILNRYRTRVTRRRCRRYTQLSPGNAGDDDMVWVTSPAPGSRDVRGRVEAEHDEQWTQLYAPDEEDSHSPPSSSILPPPATAPPHSGKTQSFVFGRRRDVRIEWTFNSQYCCGRRGNPRRSRLRARGLAAGLACDVVDIAVYPLGVFTLIACWMFLDM